MPKFPFAHFAKRMNPKERDMYAKEALSSWNPEWTHETVLEFTRWFTGNTEMTYA